ncbi:MAG: ComF family protein, partial [Candidatus Cloacimonetes bacterium]|nr:ComF family protein [Candidatus Cloacimonadota bacterium]
MRYRSLYIHSIKNKFSKFLDLIYPPLCFNCKQKLTEKSILCEKCKNKLNFLDENICFICKKKSTYNGICEDCKRKFPFDGFVSIFKFNPVMQSMIHNFKYKEYQKIGKYLSSFLAKRLEQSKFIYTIDFVVPVPLHKVKRRERGFNQALIISRNLSKILQIDLLKDFVKRKKFTATQTNLSRAERKQNVAGAFCVKNKENVHGQNFLLVDDVFTTGSTISSITQEL